MKKYLVFDWGGTYLKYGLMDEDAEILEKGKMPSPGKLQTKEIFMELIDETVSKYRDQISGIAISSPGIIDSANGITKVVGVFPYLDGCHLTGEFSKKYSLPVSIENDAKCAALAELWKGNLKGVNDGAVWVIGTSIGGGIILNGKLRRGANSSAGEFSCVNINNEDPKAKKNYLSELGTPGLCRMVAAKMHIDHTIEGEEAFVYIIRNEKPALEALKEYTDKLAIQMFNLNIELDLEKICIGGGISRQPILMEYLKNSIEEIRTYHPDIIQGMDLPLPVADVCKFHNDANLLGALYHFLYE
jgi:predicted NBD/HSP70 family sugar kinase